MQRVLIVNADDFGQTAGISRGILRAHREGIVTSASLMVRWPAAQEAVARAGHLDLGLHIDLGEWAYQDGEWVARYERVCLDDVKQVEDEVLFQLDEFRRLTGKDPTHIDSHQHVHMEEPARGIAGKVAAQLGVPLRACGPTIRYCGSFYGQTGRGEPCHSAITPASLVRTLVALSPGITELACHPGDDPGLNSSYVEERALEIETLCDPSVRQAIHELGIRLCGFSAVGRMQ